MKAAVSTAIGKIETQDVKIPDIGPGELLVKVHFCGICGSDLRGFQHGDPFAAFPHIFGHEASGEIAKLGSPTDVFKVGDRVVFDITQVCGKCRACQEGRYGDCSDIKIIGGHLPGAFAEYVKAPFENTYKIPDDMSYQLAAVCEPYTVASRGCAHAGIKPGENVLILGAGNIALCVLAVAKERGAKTILAARSESRLKRALDFAPDVIINTTKEDLYDRVYELTNGEGCEVVMEATGAKSVIEDAERYVARGGRLVIMGMCGENVSFFGYNIINKELRIMGSQNSYGQYPTIIMDLYEGKLHGDKYVSDVFLYTRAQEAFEFAIANTGNCGKVLLCFE
ncbi:MAG: alcohol dehydrogenase catalytic domain-containing protein [Clostridiales Family XIII bacterium]|jgi:2-desacetyl-2-hydroxyethyl bacteriochlorophyllide A dehydrogenase|nr:alcohol dehydrogenase catalytic domain-containing protein [Clostridiales Family XIII bacterium]